MILKKATVRLQGIKEHAELRAQYQETIRSRSLSIFLGNPGI